MNFLFFVSFFHPHLGGHERYNLNLALELLKLNHKVVVITNNTENSLKYENYKDIEIFRINCKNMMNQSYPIPNIPNSIKVFKNINFYKFDFSLVNTRFFALTHLGLLYSKMKSIKVIYIEHGSSHPKVLSNFMNALILGIDKISFKLLTKFSYSIFAVSEATRKFIVSNGKTKRTINILNNSLRFKNNDNLLPKKLILDKYKLPNDKIIIIFIGRLIYAKGVHDLINVMNTINNSILVIVGEGFYRHELDVIAGNNCHFLGAHDQINEILSISDILVNPSYSEGLPTTVIEAGEFMLPVIATDVGGTNEIIINYKTGLLVKPRDKVDLRLKLQQLIKDPDLRLKLGNNLFELVSNKFDWNKNVNKFIQVISK